ncbi:MAG TPA: Hint domain-containing protein [Paracoccus sp. (in: a-proteobacteria)]|uniref:Hint domain-containing protein n=1 Tax=Paracoccus sp. TaxID=267 RepID=UPI002C5958ED|nr:Hint domain-containing protein [Paracoccus sp. (in: a-proteobacteria)]HWL58392.1 Hint domain-containing protein [Paracoccus sp. (in: a-proteobacteria)]
MATFTVSTESVATGTIQQENGNHVVSVDTLPIDDFLVGLGLDPSNAVLNITIDDSYIVTDEDLDGDGVNDSYVPTNTPLSAMVIDVYGDGSLVYTLSPQNPNQNQLQTDNQVSGNISQFNGNYTILDSDGNEVGTLGGNIYLSSDGDFVDGQNKVVNPQDNGGFVVDDLAVCYLHGTRIMTSRGEVRIEELREGDLVVCRFGGLRPVRWIGRQTLSGLRARGQEAIRFAAGSIGENLPREPLLVSPGHSMLIGETLVLASALVNGITITREKARLKWEYYQIDLGVHDLVLAEGTWSESFADCRDFRERFNNADEYHALHPNEVAPETPLLCAPRPAGGAAFHAALAHTARRAVSARRPLGRGKLEGRIEGFAAPSHVTGWAMDADHPGQPLMLDILLDGEVIGTALACIPRKGKGHQGRMGFVFSGDRVLSVAELQRLVVRRPEDGQMLAPAACAKPGPMHGHVDLIEATGRIEGWARDKSNPGHPVLLEVVLGSEVLGTVLACLPRPDLAKVEFGDAAFLFEAGRALSADEMSLIQLRRASDGAVLRRSLATRMIDGPAGRTEAA